MLNGIKPLNEDIAEHDKIEDNFVFQNEHITNGNLDKYQNPFYSSNKIDLDKVQDLTDLVNDDEDDDTHTFNSDPYMSIMETSKNNELNSNGYNESDLKLNNDFSLGEHIKYEHDMNSKNVDDTISTANATIGSTLQFEETSFKHDEDFGNEFLVGNHIDKLAQYDDHKLNDSVSTTDAVLGSEPNTPMRMDNQSTFESENDEDQFSESFKQQLQLNQFDEHNDKENHDPFCFEQTGEPDGIIPNVVQEVNEAIDKTHHNDDDTIVPDISNKEQVSESIKHEPVEEPLCIKEQAKPIHSVYEQEYLPESDFSTSTHEALLNGTESGVSDHHENNVNSQHFEQNIIENHIEIKQEHDEEYHKVNEHLKQDHFSLQPIVTDDVELDDSDVDEIKYHAEGLKQELEHDDSDYEIEKISVNSVHNEVENLTLEHNVVCDENKYVDDLKIENHVEDFESMKPIENINMISAHNVSENIQNFVGDSLQNNYDITASQNHAENIIDVEIKPNEENVKQVDQFNIETVQNDEAVHDHIEHLEQNYENVPEIIKNNIDDFKQESNVVSEVDHSPVEDFNQENCNISEGEDSHVKVFKQENHDISEIEHSPVEDFKPDIHISEVEHSPAEDFKQENCDIIKVEHSPVDDFKKENHDISEIEHGSVDNFKQENHGIPEVEHSPVEDFKQEHYNVETKNNFVEDFEQENIVDKIEQSHVEDFLPEHQNTIDISYNVDFKQKQITVEEFENNTAENLKQEHPISEFVQDLNEDFHQEEHHEVESVQNHTVDSDEEMHSSMIIHSDVENNMPQPYCSANNGLLIKEPDMMCTSMTFEENFQNRNMSDSLYVMETSSDYFDEEIQPTTTQLEKSVDGLKVEEQSSNVDHPIVKSEQIEKEILTETKSELVNESKVEEIKTETTELNQSSSMDEVEKMDVQEENVSFISLNLLIIF